MTEEPGDAASLCAQGGEEEHRQRREDVTAERRGQQAPSAQCPKAEKKRGGSCPEAAVVVDDHQLMAEPRDVHSLSRLAAIRRNHAEREVRPPPPQPVRAGLAEGAVSVEVNAQASYRTGCHAALADEAGLGAAGYPYAATCP